LFLNNLKSRGIDLSVKPFLKWAGGKRWLVERDDFSIPSYTGRYIEPFLGSGAVFFHHRPENAILSDSNERLIATYRAISEDWHKVSVHLRKHQRLHSKEHYYLERDRVRRTLHTQAAQFLYLNRACWNGLYRVNKKGEFNVPIGTKSKILLDSDNFAETAKLLARAKIDCCDFEKTVNFAGEGDFIFVDPPYTTAHNFNGFVKYNQNIFSWADQIRLKNALQRARGRGAFVTLTNANHSSIFSLYQDCARLIDIERASVISGLNKGRSSTTESLIYLA
jgi:DNA adenine methylase